MKKQTMCRLLPRILSASLCVLAVGALGSAAESGPPAEAQRRAAALTDIGKLRLELGTKDDNAAALEALKEAARLDPANIRARFWLGSAWLRLAGLGSGRALDVEFAGRAGLEMEAVFRLAAVERSGESEDLRLRAMALLDLCAAELPASETRFAPWWRKRRAELLAGQKVVDVSHTVGRGDNAATVARRYYGDPGMAARVVEANPGVDFRKLRIGQKLSVPGVRLAPVAAVPAVDEIDRELLKKLASALPAAERRLAAERLAARESLMAVPALCGALRADESQWVRAECAKSLGAIASPDAEPFLAAALRSDAWAGCRLEAANALGRLGGRGAIEALAGARDDASPQVATAAARALGALGLAESGAPLLDALGSRSEPARRAAAWALAALGRGGVLGAAERERLDALARKGSPVARASALLALAGFDPAAGAPLAVAALEPECDEELRRAAAEALALAVAGGAGIEPERLASLAGLAANGRDPGTALGAAAAAARAGKGSPSGKEALLALAALLDEHRPVYWAEDEEPRPASGVAARLLAELTGAKLPADRAAWTAWIEKGEGE